MGVFVALLCFSSSLFFFNNFYASSYTFIETTSNFTSTSKFSLYDFYSYDGVCGDLPSNVGDQSSSNLCWAFASNTALESTLYKSGLVDADTILNFSEADIAYYAYSSRGYSSLGAGDFSMAYEYYASGLGPVNEQTWEKKSLTWEDDSLFEGYKTKLNTYDRKYSQYTVLESKSFPSRAIIESNEKLTSEEILQEKQALRNSIKEHIYTTGAVTASVYINKQYKKAYNVLYTQTVNPDHLVALVGWDDNFTYGGSKGAYIAQNSYSTTFGKNGYFYIMYDDANVENQVNGFVRVGMKTNNKKDYSSTIGSDYEDRFVTLDSGRVLTYVNTLSQTTYFANIFNITDTTPQVIKQIKVPTVTITSDKASINNDTSTFKVYVAPLSKSEAVDYTTCLAEKFSSATLVIDKNQQSQFVSQQTGYYTIELSNAIEVGGDKPYVIVYIEQLDGMSLLIDNNTKKAVDEDGNMVSYECQEAVISNPTYIAYSPTSSWEEYQFNTEKYDYSLKKTITITNSCVLPMIVSTVAKEEIKFTLENMVVEYDGTCHLPEPNITTQGDFTIEYSLDNINFYDNLEIKNVKINKDGTIGSYTIYVRVSGDIFETKTLSCSLTINPRTLTVTPNSGFSKIYGQDDPTKFTFDTSDFLESETDYVWLGNLTRYGAGSLEDVGEYEILQGTLKIKGQKDNSKFKETNYKISVKEGVKFSITKRTLYVLPLSQGKTYYGKIYGDSEPNVTVTFTNNLANETPSGEFVFTRSNGKNVGNYALTMSATLADKGSFKAKNYDVKLDPSAKFEIKKKDLVVTPNADQSKNFGKDDPTKYIYTYSATANYETPSFSGELSRVSGETVGQYEIVQNSLALENNGNFLASNYNLVFVSGVVFTIYEADLVVTFDNVSATYSGLFQSLSYSSTLQDLKIKYTYSLDGKAFSTSSSTNPTFKDCGTYIVKAKFSKDNYKTVEKQATLTITQAIITVTPKSGNYIPTYGDALNIDYLASAGQNGEQPSFDGCLGAESCNAGEQNITIGTLALRDSQDGTFKASNYQLVFSSNENATLTILKRDLKIVPIECSKTYGTADPSLDYKIENKATTDNVKDIRDSLVVNLSREEGENVGKYKITCTTLKFKDNITQSNNYNLVFDSSKFFKIKKASITIKLNNVESYYGTANDLSSSEQKKNYTIEKGCLYGSDSLDLTFSCFDDDKNPMMITSTTRRSSDKDGYLLTATVRNDNYDVTINNGRYIILYKFYNVTFVVYGVSSTTQVEHFSTVKTLPDGLSIDGKLGYTLQGWQTSGRDALLSTDDMLNSYEITCDTTFTAHFVPIEYNVFVDGEENALTTYTIETMVDLTAEEITSLVAKTGHDFLGFYLESNFETLVTQISQGSTGDKTLYPKYKLQTYTVSVANFANENYAHLVYADSVTFGTDYNFSVTLDSCYDRSYKNLQANIIYRDTALGTAIAQRQIVKGGAQFVASNVLGEFSISLSGIELNTYTISFVADGKTFSTSSKTYGQTLSTSEYPAIPTKEHYDKSAWDKVEDVVVQDDIVVTAIYTPNTYVVTFILKGEEYNVDVVYKESADPAILYQNYELGAFEYFNFDKTLDNISQNEIVNVTVGSNVFIVYIILGAIIAGIIGAVVVNIIRQHRRKKFAWWVFGK